MDCYCHEDVGPFPPVTSIRSFGQGGRLAGPTRILTLLPVYLGSLLFPDARSPAFISVFKDDLTEHHLAGTYILCRTFLRLGLGWGRRMRNDDGLPLFLSTQIIMQCHSAQQRNGYSGRHVLKTSSGKREPRVQLVSFLAVPSSFR